MNPAPPDEPNPNYARARLGTQRYSRAELAGLRRSVELLFDRPHDGELEQLVRAFERIQGRVAKPNQVGYLIRLWRIHGPATAALMRRLYAERGTDQNLLLAVELEPPGWHVDEA